MQPLGQQTGPTASGFHNQTTTEYELYDKKENPRGETLPKLSSFHRGDQMALSGSLSETCWPDGQKASGSYCWFAWTAWDRLKAENVCVCVCIQVIQCVYVLGKRVHQCDKEKLVERRFGATAPSKWKKDRQWMQAADHTGSIMGTFASLHMPVTLAAHSDLLRQLSMAEGTPLPAM